MLEPWVVQSASLPAICPVYLCANVGPQGATHCSACPILHHSESGTLSLSVRECGATGSAPALFIPYSASLGPATATRACLRPGACLRPSYRFG